MLLQKVFKVGASVGEKRVVHECERCGRAFDVQENSAERLMEQQDSQGRGSLWAGGTSDAGRWEGPKQTGS